MCVYSRVGQGQVNLFFLGLLHDLPRHLSIQLEHRPQQHGLVETQLDDVKHDQNRDDEADHEASHIRVDLGRYGYELRGVDRVSDRGGGGGGVIG